MTDYCTSCRHYLGKERLHGTDEICPTRESLWCSQCGCRGHLPSECTDVVHVTRPSTYEELIAPELRARWGILTKTPIIYDKPTVEIAEREISELNVIEIRYRKGTGRDSKLDARLREFMRQNRLDTTHSCDANLAKLRRWAVSQGKKIRLVPE